MKILIEGYHYNSADVVDILYGLDTLTNINNEVAVNYVGYLYNPQIQDCVFILPKVLVDKDGKAFSHLDPKEIINLEESKTISDTERAFIYEFAVWIYRTLRVYKNFNSESDIVFYRQMAEVGNAHRHMTNTFLEVLLALVEFNKKNQNFFMTILKNIHSGYNKINWTRTISHSTAIVQNNAPVYLNPVNKKRQINFDEELLVIFFSILQYINGRYGFPVNISLGFELINGAKFDNYLNGYGKVRLRQIKYKYFSDKALYLWELCYAFFDRSEHISVASNLKEYLIAKNFNIVFESIIDELIGDPENKLPKDLKDQKDGKRVDHLYSDEALTTIGEEYNVQKDIFFIGDSKYYNLSHNVSDESVYKQYTYARNLIQWNMDLFLNPGSGDNEWKDKIMPYRDEATEGYNVVPNFFISARMDRELSYDDKIYETDREKKSFMQRHFENRLFDRDTLLIYHYDVNFLYIISLYSRNNDGEKQEWKARVRKKFREEIQQMLQEKFDFYAMIARPSVADKEYIRQHFQSVLGKVYRPFKNNEIYSLALDRDEKYADENQELLKELETYFYLAKCELGKDPQPVISEAIENDVSASPDSDYDVVLVNYANEAHRELYLKHHLCYMRTGDERGSIKLPSFGKDPKYLLLHNGKEGQVFRLEEGGGRLFTRESLEKKGFHPKNGEFFLVYTIKEMARPLKARQEIVEKLIKRGHKSSNPEFFRVEGLIEK